MPAINFGDIPDRLNRYFELRALVDTYLGLGDIDDPEERFNRSAAVSAANDEADVLANQFAREDVLTLIRVAEKFADRLADFSRALDAANARTAERCRELMAARREIEQLKSERDHWQQIAAGGGDCPVDGCSGETLRLEVFGGGAWSRLDCGHDVAQEPEESGRG